MHPIFYGQDAFCQQICRFFNIGFTIILGILTVYLARKKAGGYVTFKEAFTPYLIAIAIGVTVNYIVYNILFHFVDPSAKDLLNKALYDLLVETLNNSGLPQEQINEQLTKSKQLDLFDPKEQLFMWSGSILRNSVLGLLLAAIFKNKSEFINPTKEDAPQATTPSDTKS